MTDFERLIATLTQAEVEFIVIGGFAGTAHGSAHLTVDLDVVYRRRLGARGLALRVEWRLKRKSRADKEAIVAGRPSRRALLLRLGVSEALQPVRTDPETPRHGRQRHRP